MPKPTRIRPVTLRYDYPGVWIAGAFLIVFGAVMGVIGFQVAGPAPAPPPGRPPTPDVPLAPVLLGAGVLAALGLGLVWLARRLSERFAATADGISWRAGGRVRAEFRWRDVRRVRLPDVRRSLVIEPVEGAPVEVPAYYPRFKELLALLARVVDLEGLARADEQRADSPPDRRPPPAHPGGSEVLSPPDPPADLPLVWRRAGPSRLAALGAIACAVLSYLAWLEPEQFGKFAADADGLLAVRIAAPILTAIGLGVALTSLTRFTVTARGVELRTPIRTRRYPWANVVSVRARHAGNEAGARPPRLQIFLRNELSVELFLGWRVFAFRDAMLAAALAAGVFLPPDRRPSPRRRAVSPTAAAIPLPKALTVSAAASSRPSGRGSIRLRVRDEHGAEHDVVLSDQEFSEAKENAVIRSLPSRLFFDDQLVAIGSGDEQRLIELLETARIARQLDAVPEAWGAGLTVASSPKYAEGILRRLLAFLDSNDYR
ncbi:MAG: PH domain-containing protein [Gemmataceae bacterium]